MTASRKSDFIIRSTRHGLSAMAMVILSAIVLAGCDQSEDHTDVDVSQLRGTALMGESTDRKTQRNESEDKQQGDKASQAENAGRVTYDSASTNRMTAPDDSPTRTRTDDNDIIQPDFSTQDYFSIHEEAGPPLPIAPPIDGYTSIRWEKLQFDVREDVLWIEDFQPGDKPLKADKSMVPENVRALDGKKLAIIGYMIPIDFRGGGTSEFMLVPIVPSCFFCEEPLPTEWIDVKTADGRYVPYISEFPVTVAGTLEVGAVYSGGMMESMFRLKADKVERYELELAF